MKSKIQSTMMACVALLCAGFASCTDDALMESSNKYAGQTFELTVTQTTPESRLELGQDGLTTQWEPGDKLVLVDKTRTLAPIFLNCTLDEPASSATFVAESGVPAGDYYVIYNYNENLSYGHKGFQSVGDINSHDDLVLWNELKILEGEDNASISLQHLYAKVRVELKNASGGSFNVGMYSSKKGFPMYKQFTSNGLVNAEYGVNPNSMNYTYTQTYFPSDRKFHNIPFGFYSPEYAYDETTGGEGQDWSKAAELSALVLPSDLSEEDVYFYVLSGNTCYEFKKAGVDFKAGTSYKVVLDMAGEDVKTSTLTSTYDNDTYQTVYQLTNAVDWRHAAYKNARMYDEFNWSDIAYKLVDDIDFTEEVFFPIATTTLVGDNHKLSNLKLEWSDEDNIGLIRFEWTERNENFELKNNQFGSIATEISDLILENVTFSGNNFVGALGGHNIKASNCEVIGNSVIEGQGNYVGGVVGVNSLSSYNLGGMYNNDYLKFTDVRIGQNTTVNGKNYIGGIVGAYSIIDNMGSTMYNSSLMLMESCKSEGTVTATEDYVGGIFGKIGGSYYNSNSTSSWIEFSMEDYTFSLIKCVNEGAVTGRHYVGGIGGDFAVTSDGGGSTLDRVVLSQSCSTGDVTGNSKVGGILGSSMAATNICYSTGEISATTSMVGGIVGEITGGSSSRIANCYSLATLSASDNTKTGGIVGVSGMTTITNCYYAADPNTYSFGGIVGNSGGAVTVSNCLTTLNSLGTNLGDHESYGPKRDWMDTNNDGKADYDYDGNGSIDNNDLYEWYYNYKDNTTNSISAVTSILDNIAIINGDNAYSNNYWDINLYPWYCVKFASFSADTNSPDFDDETIQ